jgi:hypothetical protein
MRGNGVFGTSDRASGGTTYQPAVVGDVDRQAEFGQSTDLTADAFPETFANNAESLLQVSLIHASPDAPAGESRD